MSMNKSKRVLSVLSVAGLSLLYCTGTHGQSPAPVIQKTGDVVLKASIPSRCLISVQELPASKGIDLNPETQQRHRVGTVTEVCNEPTGYDVTMETLNNGAISGLFESPTLVAEYAGQEQADLRAHAAGVGYDIQYGSRGTFGSGSGSKRAQTGDDRHSGKWLVSDVQEPTDPDGVKHTVVVYIGKDPNQLPAQDYQDAILFTLVPKG